MWRQHLNGVPNALIEKKYIFLKDVGDTPLRFRRRFMRTSYVPWDVLESATKVSLELNDLIRVLNFTCSDNFLVEGTSPRATNEYNSSFTDDLSDSGPQAYIPSLSISDEEDEMV
jgi:hypothetical protein